MDLTLLIALLVKIGIVLIIIIFLLWVIGIVVVGANEVGIVQKKWGTKSLKEGYIALNKEAGYQPDTLGAGLHFRTPILFRVIKTQRVTITEGELGIVFARDGASLASSQKTARIVKGNNDFQDTRFFLKNGGQKGPQRQMLREGSYGINLAQFIVLTSSKIYAVDLRKDEENQIKSMHSSLMDCDGFHPVKINHGDDKIGVVVANEGASLDPDKDGIIAPKIPNHQSFQDIELFIENGGKKGRQLEVLIEGTYFINRLCFDVALFDKVNIEQAQVGVVISYVGEKGEDLSGAEFTHGELVSRGERGVWGEPLSTGKYALNPYAYKVIKVPTENILLKWNKDETGSHRFDANLSEIELYTRDGFLIELPLSVVMNIDYRTAPIVIQRFGNIESLINNTLNPFVSALFKNTGQQKELLEIMQKRLEITEEAQEKIKSEFSKYDLRVNQVLIDTPKIGDGNPAIAVITKLQDRKIADESVETSKRETIAAEQQRILQEAQTRAQKQGELTASLIQIDVSQNMGQADVKKAEYENKRIQTISEAEAKKIRNLAEAKAYETKQIAEARKIEITQVGQAEADIILQKGIATAEAAQKEIDAYKNVEIKVNRDILMSISQNLKDIQTNLVPNQVVTLGNNDSNIEHPLLSLLTAKIAGIDFINEGKNLKSNKEDIDK